MGDTLPSRLTGEKALTLDMSPIMGFVGKIFCCFIMICKTRHERGFARVPLSISLEPGRQLSHKIRLLRGGGAPEITDGTPDGDDAEPRSLNPPCQPVDRCRSSSRE